MRTHDAAKHEDTLLLISAVALIALLGFGGLFAGELLLAKLINGHSPDWGTAAHVIYASGIVLAVAWGAVMLLRGAKRGL